MIVATAIVALDDIEQQSAHALPPGLAKLLRSTSISTRARTISRAVTSRARNDSWGSSTVGAAGIWSTVLRIAAMPQPNA